MCSLCAPLLLPVHLYVKPFSCRSILWITLAGGVAGTRRRGTRGSEGGKQGGRPRLFQGRVGRVCIRGPHPKEATAYFKCQKTNCFSSKNTSSLPPPWSSLDPGSDVLKACQQSSESMETARLAVIFIPATMSHHLQSADHGLGSPICPHAPGSTPGLGRLG